MYRASLANESQLSQEIRQRERQTKDTDDRLAGLQQNMGRLTKKLETLKKNIQMDKDRLLTWEEKLNRKEEKNMVIEQFVKSDEKMFKVG